VAGVAFLKVGKMMAQFEMFGAASAKKNHTFYKVDR
jgi:hypothetical protein